ncbi:hypothetical protein NO263_08615 [Gluconacetobacter entanii]|uniref:Uncharacterized protein n=1 Tax=Gluconacetobacter entanii TaxID=108528 RepID=A0ABT3K5E3_9PROT|nr:hypothetical protein [Gluconacetobacter entanii]MCW4590640.1 hypothetical protein [Gluconacetobacter entanii]MCW4594169.1 hypothetical protein [Gluconacetobacter entanii]
MAHAGHGGSGKRVQKFLGAAFFQKGGVFEAFWKKASPKTSIIDQ